MENVKRCHHKFICKLRSSIAGLTPEEIALAVVAGLVLGAFPIFGLPTVLCGLAAPALRVSFPMLQVVNQIMTPVQLLLLIPLSRVGSGILGASAGLAGVAVNAVAGWCCLCIPAGVMLYFAIRLILLAWRRRASAELPISCCALMHWSAIGPHEQVYWQGRGQRSDPR